jgi:hypothetical protein
MSLRNVILTGRRAVRAAGPTRPGSCSRQTQNLVVRARAWTGDRLPQRRGQLGSGVDGRQVGGKPPGLWPAVIGEPQLVLTDVTIHPEMLAIAHLLITSQRAPGMAQDIAARLGFPCPGSPHPLDPLQSRPSRSLRTSGGAMAINIPARLRDEDFATCLAKRYLAPGPATRRAR